jgi:hypothetical protein
MEGHGEESVDSREEGGVDIEGGKGPSNCDEECPDNIV